MGLSIQQLKEYAQLLGKTYDKLTKEEKRAAEYALSQGDKKGEDKATETKTPIDTTTTAAGFKGAGPFVDLAEAAADFTASFSAEGIGKSVDTLIVGAQGLGNSMGVGRARAAEFRAMIADTVPEMTKLGFTQDETLRIMADIPKQLGVNTTLTKETIVEIGSAAKISGTEAGDLANKFKGVGFNLADVGDEMAKAANYAKSVGVNVKAVTGELVANLKNLNLFNFENGVQGLTKMVAQSKMLGVNMEKVLNKAEDLMNPEKAISSLCFDMKHE